MACTAGGGKDLAWAREQVSKTRSADELRQAQAILLPLELGLMELIKTVDGKRMTSPSE